jgi:hypothetical protein
MSPKNLRAEAAKTGAMAGMEFEMIVPSISTDEIDAASQGSLLRVQVMMENEGSVMK